MTHKAMTEEKRRGSDATIALNNSLFKLIEHARTTGAPQDVIEAATTAVEAITEQLAPHQTKGPYSAANLNSQGEYDRRAPSQNEIMSYSPLIGNLNPISPQFEMHNVDGKIQGQGHFPVSFAGPPDTAHGGMVAALCDELLTAAVMADGPGAYTGTLTIRYLARTQILRDTQLFGETTKREGRKVLARGEIRQDDIVTAIAEGVFIQPKTRL